MNGKDCEGFLLYGRGDRKAQRKRHRDNNKGVPILEDEYLLIDNNYSNRPYKYCSYYKAYLTKNLVIRHKCEKRECCNLKSLEWANNKFFNGDI